jgi:hypothetical protein
MLEEQTLDALATRANEDARRHHGVDGRLGQGLGPGALCSRLPPAPSA